MLPCSFYDDGCIRFAEFLRRFNGQFAFQIFPGKTFLVADNSFEISFSNHFSTQMRSQGAHINNMVSFPHHHFIVFHYDNGIIVFNAGAAVTITNVPTIQLNRITVTGGTDVILQGAANAVLTLNNVAGNTEFVIDAGSSLAIGTNVNLILGNGSAANIAGTFTIDNGRTYDTDNNNTVVASTGIINNFGIINSGNNDLSFAGGATYIHAQNGGVVPAATWDNNSNCNITGVTTTIPSPASFNQEFGNFMWDCPAQTGNLSFIGNLQNIDSNFVVANTGATGALNLAISGVNFTTTIGGDYIQTGGSFEDWITPD